MARGRGDRVENSDHLDWTSAQARAAGASEDPQDEDRSGGRDDQVAEKAVIVQAEHAGQRAADERTGDAHQNAGEQPVLLVMAARRCSRPESR